MIKPILLLMSVQFLVYLGFGIIIPVLPEVIVQHDWQNIHVGGLLTVYSLASFLPHHFGESFLIKLVVSNSF